MNRLTRALITTVVWVIAGAVLTEWVWGYPTWSWEWEDPEKTIFAVTVVVPVTGAWLLYWILRGKK